MSPRDAVLSELLNGITKPAVVLDKSRNNKGLCKIFRFIASKWCVLKTYEFDPERDSIEQNSESYLFQSPEPDWSRYTLRSLLIVFVNSRAGRL